MTGPIDEAEILAAQKLALRDRLLTDRRRRSLWEARAAAQRIAELLLETRALRHAATVAAYVSMAHEPGTAPLLEALRAQGKRVILPVLEADGDLDWAVHDGEVRSATRGLLEPVGPSLGRDAIATADVVLAPGLAVASDGTRLGRGGGSYDRALARVPLGTFTCTLLYDEEYPVEVPAAPHDRPVVAVAQPSGVHLTGWARGRAPGR